MSFTKGVTLAEVCSAIVDCEHKTAPVQKDGFPSIRTPNIGRGRLILEKVNRVSKETYNEWTKRAKPQAGDLILAREAPIGNVAIVPENMEICLGQRTVLIRPNFSIVFSEYLLYLLLGDTMQERMRAPANGSTVHHLNVEDIKALRLPSIPPLPIQRKIAAILSAYDDLIENNTRRIAILEQMAQAIYREWFVEYKLPFNMKTPLTQSELGMIPAGWQVANFSSVTDIKSGSTPKTSEAKYWNGTIPFFTPKDAGAHFFVLDTEKTLTEDGVKECRSGVLPKNTIFITARGTVGKVILASRKMTMNQSCYALFDKASKSQYFLFLLTKQITSLLKKMSHGAVFDTITVETFNKIVVALPPTNIIDEFDRIIAPIFEQIQTLQAKSQQLQKNRELLLHKLIGGEIDVSNLEIIESKIQ